MSSLANAFAQEQSLEGLMAPSDYVQKRASSYDRSGSEDYFLGAWDFGDHPFAYVSFGAPVKGDELAGGRSSVYRFHLDSPIPFTKSLKATIEHGHAKNHRSDNFYSVAYWYQLEPHGAFPPLPSVEERLPRLYPVGGAGKRRQRQLSSFVD